MSDLVVRGGEVLTPDGRVAADVVIRAGRITAVARRDVAAGSGAARPRPGSDADVARRDVVARSGAARPRPGSDADVAADLAERERSGLGGRADADPADDPVDLPVLDARGLVVAPGFVDLQCNGAGGIDLTTSPERLWEVAALLPQWGVTAWLPTIVTSPDPVRQRALTAMRTPHAFAGRVDAGGPEPATGGTGGAVHARPGGGRRGGGVGSGDDERKASGADPVRGAGKGTHAGSRGGRRLAGGQVAAGTGAAVLGLHFEGPFLAPSRRGAHPAAHLRAPDPEAVAGWSRDAGVAVVTLAPELPGALDLVRRLVDQGVVVSLGHSAATAGEATAAVDAGARWVTHLFNAMGPWHHRDPGLAGVALTDERLAVGVIADGVHLHPLVVRLAVRALGPRLTLVSDAVAALGAPSGRLRLGEVEAVADAERVRLADGTLAGSATSLDRAVAHLAVEGGASLDGAVAAVTSAPARLLGLEGERGVVAPGAAGDLVLLDPARLPGSPVVATVIGGQLAHADPTRTLTGAPGHGR